MEKTGFYGYVYGFSVDYHAIAVDDILEIHKYLLKKNWYKIIFGFIKKIFFTAITFFSYNALKCVSMNNQECRLRPEVTNINTNEP